MADDAREQEAAARRRKIHGRWQGGYRVELTVRDGRFTLTSDEGPEEGGTDTGPMPSELLFSSLASCFAMAIEWVAKKRHHVLPDLEVIVTWGYDVSQRWYDHVQIEAMSSMATTAPEEFELLVQRATDVCWVSRTMKHGVPISVRASTLQR
jgi:organic hydroperoxide reductase OsmC/OhrA